MGVFPLVCRLRFLGALALIFACMVPSSLPAEEPSLYEQFALAKDRTAVLGKLIPGTEDYFFFHVLHYQNSGRYQDAGKLLEQWLAQHGRTGQATRMLYRQYLLTFDTRPTETRDFLVRELGIPLHHELPATVRERRYPSKLDPALLDPALLVRNAITQQGNLGQLHPWGLLTLDGGELPMPQLRELLNRYPHVREPRLVTWIVRELGDPESQGFGSLAIHRMLTLEQLDAIEKQRPDLLGNQTFVFAKLERLRPSTDVDLHGDPKAWLAYLRSLEAFTRKLPPAFRSLRASVLYQLLDAQRRDGEYDKALFVQYLELPRNVPYILPVLLERAEGPPAQLDQDFSQSIWLPPIGNEEPLVRDYLERFLKDAANINEFARFFRQEYLKQVFIETKILNGVGDAKTWFNQLSPDAQRLLRERVEVDWSITNPKFWDLEGPVRLRVKIKNVPRLTVRVFRINLPAYYRQSQQPVNTDLDLDGLVAATQWEETFDQSAWLRHEQEIELKGVEGRGVWIVDIVGNGRRSRSLVTRGDLRVVTEKTVVGHRFTVLDEANKPVPDAKLLVAGQEWEANEKGEIVVPFVDNSVLQQAIVVAGNFAKLVPFMHEPESYTLQGTFYIHREGLQAGEQTRLMVRAHVMLGDRPVSIKMFEKPVVTVTATDMDGSQMTQRFEDVQLFEDRETEIVLRTPPRLRTLAFHLSGKVNLRSVDREMTLEANDSYDFETIRTTTTLYQAQLTRTADGYRLEVVGHTGEFPSALPVHLQLHTVIAQQPVEVTLAPDEQGQIVLGPLENVSSIQVSGPQLLSHGWQLKGDFAAWPDRIQAAQGETIRLPVAPARKLPAARSDDERRVDLRWQLLETRDGTVRHDRTELVKELPGGLEITNLPAGGYELRDLSSDQVVQIEVASGSKVGRFVAGSARTLESIERPTPRIESIKRDGKSVAIKLADTNSVTRVHVLLSRYVPAIPMHDLRVPRWTPRLEAYRRPWSGYVSNLRLDDEYRYILERQLAKKYPGNMLPQPTLLVNPWDLGESQSKEILMAGGDAVPPASAPAPAPMAGAMEPESKLNAAARPGDPLTAEYLRHGGELLLNLVPDKQGLLTIDPDLVDNAQIMTIALVDPLGLQVRRVSLDATPLEKDDLRLASSLPRDRAFAQTRAVMTIKPEEPLEIGDLQSARAQVYASLAELYQYYAAQIKDERFARFAFVTTWHQLDDEAKRSKYNEFACHELHLFLYFKDRPFFDEVVGPLIKQKKDPQFMDHWLLGHDLSGYTELWAYSQLNAAERALLSVRIEAQQNPVSRDMKDWLEAHPVSPEEEHRLLLAALAGRGLSMHDNGVVMLADTDRKETDALALGVPLEKRQLAEREELRRDAAKAKREASSRWGSRNAPRGGNAAPEGAFAGGGLGGAADYYFDMPMDFAGKPIYRQIDATKRWAESQYYRLTNAQVTAELVPMRKFWRDLAIASKDGKGKSLSSDLLSPVANFNEALLALAVIDLPLTAPPVESEAKEGKLVVRSTLPAVVVTEQIREVKVKPDQAPSVLIGRRFTADNAPPLPGKSAGSVAEFVMGQVYRSQLVLSNPTAEPVNADVLLQIPAGSLPLEAVRPTDSRRIRLEPFSTQQLQIAFYFPVPGDFVAYGPVASEDSNLLAATDSADIKVLAEPSEADPNSWPYIVQHGTPEQVVRFIREKANLHHVALGELAPRMNDPAMFSAVTAVLDELHRYEATLWGYAFKHLEAKRMSEFLEQRPDVVSLVGPVITSKLLAVDPTERELYEHIEYRPLEVPRKHAAGGRWQIPNAELQGQWNSLMELLSYQAAPTDVERLALTYFLLLQARVEEAIVQLDQIDRNRLAMPMAYDYMTAYVDFYRGRYADAQQLAANYLQHPSNLWRQRFAQVDEQVREHLAMMEGETIELPNADDTEKLVSTAEARRDREQGISAALQPTIDMRVEGKQIHLRWKNLEAVEVNYYILDVELLFSRNPFVQQGSTRASFIEPNDRQRLKLPDRQGETLFGLPASLAHQNVLVEVVAGNLRQNQVVSGGDLAVQLATGYGQLQASLAATTKPMIGAYVKVYAQDQNGQVRFWKDGYTDLRGRFDYATVSGSPINEVQRFALLVLDPEHGAQIREVEPPR